MKVRLLGILACPLVSNYFENNLVYAGTFNTWI
jgi:uncharacterized protein YbaR (Trm112 family)